LSADTEEKATANDQLPVLHKDWRFYSGMSALVLALVLPLLALAVPLLGLSTAASAALVGALVAGGPEVLILLAAALLGKNVLHYFTARIKRRLWEAAMVRPVSKLRYYIGLAIALVSLVPFYLYGYFPHLMPPDDARIWILAGSDLSFIASVFLMGGEFWEKVRRLFVWEGKP
jgi:hypothetical protein